MPVFKVCILTSHCFCSKINFYGETFMTTNSGIYVLYFECADGQYYIGKSGNFNQRYKEHCRKLKAGTHINKNLQAGYYIYGLPTMEPLEEVTNLADQSSREVYWIKTLDSFKNGMNETIGGDGLGFGANTPYSYYTEKTYIEILELLANTDKLLSNISEELGVEYSIVQKISNGSEHSWLADRFPELWSKVSAKCGTRKGLIYEENTYKQVVLLASNKNNTLQDIVTATGLNISVVKNITYGYQHIYLKNLYPVEYSQMIALSGKRRKGTTNRNNYPDVKSPSGIVYKVENSRKFANTHGLLPSNFHRLLKGVYRQHKGWTLA